jgi:hypothetical protein
MFDSLFSKKYEIFLYEKNQGWKKFKGRLKYLIEEKAWELQFGGEKIPVGEDIFNYIFDKNKIIIRREGPNQYLIINPNAVSPEGLEAKVVPPEEIAKQLIRAVERRERLKGFWDRNLPIITMATALIIIGIFIAIVWSSTGESMKTISANFKGAMDVLQNITQTQLEILQKLRGVETLPTIPTPAK